MFGACECIWSPMGKFSTVTRQDLPFTWCRPYIPPLVNLGSLVMLRLAPGPLIPFKISDLQCATQFHNRTVWFCAFAPNTIMRCLFWAGGTSPLANSEGVMMTSACFNVFTPQPFLTMQKQEHLSASTRGSGGPMSKATTPRSLRSARPKQIHILSTLPEVRDKVRDNATDIQQESVLTSAV